jgi:DNA-binding NtrC family response regulator
VNNRSPKHARILVVDDDHEMCALLTDLLIEEGHEAEAVYSAEEATDRLESTTFNLMISDIKMQGMKGLDLLAHTKEKLPSLPVLMITAFGSIESAIEAMKRGAFHYLTKPFRNEEFLHLVSLALEQGHLRRDVERLQAEVEERYEFENLIGGSPAMRRLYDLIERVAEVHSTVLITGESGTGKELVAKAIHYKSKRKDRPFVPVNCAALPEALLESELFGHVRGAFTGATTDKKGLFEEADEGTLFLDEISEMAPSLQGKLLRVLEDGQVRRVGTNRNHSTDVRVFAATNRDLEEEVQSGAFREDLFYRVNVLTIELPPLRERGDDILRLADHFVRKTGEATGRPALIFSPETHALLRDYLWPGNVRELANAIERAATLCRSEVIEPADLPERIRDWRSKKMDGVGNPVRLEDLERGHILRVLDSVAGNKSRAADLLGIDRKTLYRKLELYAVI